MSDVARPVIVIGAPEEEANDSKKTSIVRPSKRGATFALKSGNFVQCYQHFRRILENNIPAVGHFTNHCSLAEQRFDDLVEPFVLVSGIQVAGGYGFESLTFAADATSGFAAIAAFSSSGFR